MLRRVLLFILTNFLVMMTISIIVSVLGLNRYLDANGINYQSLMVFCALWGMGGAFVSLMLSKTMAKWAMGVRIIDPAAADPTGRELVGLVHRLSAAAGLPAMPEVGIYDSPEVNAFATGPTRGNALVAVSTGLLQRMGRVEVEGVLGHEVAHIANGDMVTMTLIQGVINAFVMFFARIVAFAVTSAMRGDDRRGPSYMVQHLLVMVLEMVFGLLGAMVVCYFSRQREYRADAGSARLGGRDKMIAALSALQRASTTIDPRGESFATLKISGKPSGFLALLLTHPPLEARIDRLRQLQAV